MVRTGQKYLIVNADGYGFTPGVNRGIIEAFESGLVTSTSCTPNFGHIAQAGAVQKQFPHVSFGIHFNLNVGRPNSDPAAVPSLLGEDGQFLGSKLSRKLLVGSVKLSEVEVELSAQAAVLADQGVRVSHWDGHQNKHLWPGYFEAAMRVAKRFGIKGIRSHRRTLYTNHGPASAAALAAYYVRNPARIATHLGGRFRTFQASAGGLAAADRLITPGYADNSHKSLESFWTTLAKTLPHGCSEVYCHPGYVDRLLRSNSQYVDQREDEVRIMTNPSTLESFSEAGIRLINFWDLAKMKANE